MVTRIALVFALLMMGVVALLGWVSWRTSRAELVAQAHQTMDHSMDVADDLFRNVERVLDDNLEVLATNPAVADWCARKGSDDTTGLAQARERVAAFMGPFINGRIFFSQMRLIGADSAGTEIIRFQREGDHVLRVPDGDLQAKGDRPYVNITNAAPAGARLSFPIDLNRENRPVTLPDVPTLRYTAPLFDPQGARVGMLAINTDMRMIFGQLLSMADSGRVMMLARADGEVVLHPDTALTFRFEQGGSKKISEILPASQRGDMDYEALVGYRTITLGPSKDVYTLAITQPMSGLLGELRHKRNSLTMLFTGVAFAAISLMALLAYRVGGRLNQLTGLMERYAVGSPVELPTERSDEIGRMARGLRIMQERIDDRVRELEEARAAAEASDRQRRELLANMSHEVRTPLNAIIGMSDGVDMSILGGPDQERLAIIRRSALRLKGLVDDLLTHARIGEGKLALIYSSVDVRTLVQDIVLAHRPAAEAKTLRIRVQLDDLPQLVHTDGLRLHQVIDNLVGNAVRFTQSGEVVIAADVLKGNTLRILVWDTGPGIPLESQQRVFERFERASGSEQDGGVGLGLAITKRVVDLLGGTIELESEPGKGSRFIVRVPIRIVQAQTLAATAAPDTSGLRVLYVEDIATNRMLVQEWAAHWGWDLTVVETGEDAVRVCARLTFDLLLIDLGLGNGMSGLELAQRLRAAGPHQYAPMIALTAYAADGEDAEALKSGMNDRVIKPVDRDTLLRTVAFWCDRSALGPEPPDLRPLAKQYDEDAEKLRAVYTRYRTEFVQRRLALRAALITGNEKALNDARHALRPHWQLLGLDTPLAKLEELTALNGEQDMMVVESTFRACDRAFLGALRHPVTAI